MSNNPDDRERPVTRREFRMVTFMMAGAFIVTAASMFCLLVLEIKG
ncbi:hypothetical protein ACLQ2N_32965 [Streptomyces sp. DT224]